MAKNIYCLNTNKQDVSLNIVSSYITNAEPNYYNCFSAYKNAQKPEKDNFVGLIHTISGKGTLETVNGKFEQKENNLILIKHNEIVSFSTQESDWHFYSIWFYIRGLKLEFEKTNIIPPLENEKETILQIINLINSGSKLSTIKADSLCLSLVVDYLSYNDFSNNTMPYKAKLDSAIQYIYDNIEKPIKVDDLASLCGFCNNHFCNLFKNYTGLTPKQFIINSKLRESVFLLFNSTLSIETISDKLSFFSQSYYISCFKAHYNITPAQFRKTKTLTNFLLDN